MRLQLHLRPLPRALRYQLKYFISRSCGACGVLDQHIVKHLASWDTTCSLEGVLK